MNPTFYSDNDYRLYHHGILGMKWGIRRYQNPDGSLTDAGRKRLGFKSFRKSQRNEKSPNREKRHLTDKQKKAVIIGAAAVGTVLAVYGGVKVYKAVKALDADSAMAAKQMLTKTLSKEAGLANAGVKSGIPVKPLKSDAAIDELSKELRKKARKDTFTVRNVTKQVGREIKTDGRDLKEAWQVSKLNPWRNPFSSKSDLSKYLDKETARKLAKSTDASLSRELDRYKKARSVVENASKTATSYTNLSDEADEILKEFTSRHVKNATQNGAESFRKAASEVDDLTEELLKRGKRS